jgi:uncharacterized surface protein with fasciclin (FAS1) repeats
MRVSNTNIKSLVMKNFTLLLFVLALGLQSQAQTVAVGGAPMYPQKDIVSNALNSADHTTLVAAVKAAGLVSVLQGDGPFTVFAPVNDAFENLPEGTVENLLKKSNKEKLQAVLTYHVLAGDYDFKSLKKAISKAGGSLELKTVQGAVLTFTMNGPNNILLEDANGNQANITVYDVYQKNGVIHVIDSVLLP